MRRSPPHKWLLNIQPSAKRAFDGLPPSTRRTIFRILRELLNAEDPYTLPAVEMLKEAKFERIRRFRAGDYRVFFVVEAREVTHLQHTYKGTLYLLDIRDRKAAY